MDATVGYAVGALLLAMVIAFGVWYWYSRRPQPIEPSVPIQLLLTGEVDYMGNRIDSPYFTVGYWTDYYFTIYGTGTPPALAVDDSWLIMYRRRRR
jgi:hypothetical protein